MKRFELKKKIKFSKIKKKDISKNWVGWLNDPQVRRYSTKKMKHTYLTQVNFLKNKLNDKNTILFGIYLNKEHIGNIEITRINHFHKHCEIMYLIGVKKYWNYGFGTSVVSFGVNYAKKKLKLKKIIAGTFSNNISSIKVLKKNNFKLEGRIKNFYLNYDKKKRVDKLVFGKLLK